MRFIFRPNIFLSFFLFLIFLSGCSEDIENDPRFFKSFPEIKTNQFMWSYGRGGIYWVSDNQVVLDAEVANKLGVLERGLYQIDVRNGSYFRLLDYSEHYWYCFNGETLFVRLKNKKPIINEPKGYKLVQETDYKERNKNLHNAGLYSQLRCDAIDRPSDDGYRQLFANDGYLKTDNKGTKYSGKDYRFRGELDPDNKVVLVDKNLKEIKDLDLKISEVSTPYFIPHENAYFGYKFNNAKMCGLFWWLYRDDWSVKTNEQCFGIWSQNSSKLFYPTKAGLFVQHYTTKKYKSYLFARGREFQLEKTSSIGGSIAPDGCRVAYGSGELIALAAGQRQILKVFNACKFIEEQGESKRFKGV